MEVPNDRAMVRTARRPLPAGKLTVRHAAAFATLSSAAGVGLLVCHGNPLMAALAGGNVLLYALCYTPLKQISIWNTWVGAVVGPPRPMIYTI
jgi:heme o synthase